MLDSWKIVHTMNQNPNNNDTHKQWALNPPEQNKGRSGRDDAWENSQPRGQRTPDVADPLATTIRAEAINPQPPAPRAVQKAVEVQRAPSQPNAFQTRKVQHGPSNLTLAILWIMALISVGVAAFLYAMR